MAEGARAWPAPAAPGAWGPIPQRRLALLAPVLVLRRAQALMRRRAGEHELLHVTSAITVQFLVHTCTCNDSCNSSHCSRCLPGPLNHYGLPTERRINKALPPARG